VNTSGGATGISGSSAGTLTIGEVSVAGNGPAVALSNYNQSVSFISLSSTGSTGISLSNTTGTFSVTGSGGVGGSGGTITGGNPNILLNNASGVSLAFMNVQSGATDGIRGTSVNGLTLTNVVVVNNGAAQFDHGVDLTNPTGTVSVTNSTFTGSADDNFVVQSSLGTLTLNVDNSTFSSNSASVVGENDGLLVKADTNANVTISVTGSTFHANKGDHFQVALANAANAAITFTGNTLTGGNAGALAQDILINAATGVPGYSGTVTYDISNNTITGAILSAINVDLGTSSSSASMSGIITNNQIGDATTLSGSAQAFGIAIDAHGNGTHSVRVESNTIQHVYDRGISVLANDGGGTLNMKIFKNTVTNIEGAFGRQGLFISVGSASSNVFGLPDSHTVCAQIGGGVNANNLTHQPTTEVDDFRIRQRINTTVRLPGYGGSAFDLSAVAAFISGNNNSAVGSADSTGSGVGFQGGAACSTP
jgi:hypothetical protein